MGTDNLSLSRRVRLAAMLKDLGERVLYEESWLTAEEKGWVQPIALDGKLNPTQAKKIACDVLTELGDAKTAGSLVDWRGFEVIVKMLLELGGFIVDSPFRYKTLVSRGEIDVAAIRDRYVLFIDCKRYGANRSALSQLKTAACEQRERVEEFLDVFPQLASRLITSAGKYRLIPAIVPWVGSEIVYDSAAVIVPSSRLPSFIRHLDDLAYDVPAFELEIK